MPMDAYTVDLEAMGKRIRALRQAQNKTQGAFADMLHISTSYLALIEQGKRTASLDIIAQISGVCSVSADFLLFGESDSSSSANQKIFQTLCRRYTNQDIERALRLSSFYLNMENQIH